MRPRDFGFDTWQEILEPLEHAGMTDYEKYPELYIACEVARDTHDFTLLDELLTRDPWIVQEAKRESRNVLFFNLSVKNCTWSRVSSTWVSSTLILVRLA